jgi:hypothetical protein
LLGSRKHAIFSLRHADVENKVLPDLDVIKLHTSSDEDSILDFVDPTGVNVRIWAVDLGIGAGSAALSRVLQHLPEFDAKDGQGSAMVTKSLGLSEDRDGTPFAQAMCSGVLVAALGINRPVVGSVT